MSGNRPTPPGLLSATLGPVFEGFHKHSALPREQKAVARAMHGAATVVACIYTAATFGMSAFPKPWPAVLVGVAGFGLLLLVAGLRGTRGQPRDMMAAFWSLALPAGGWWAMQKWLPGLWYDAYGRGICITILGAAAIRFFIATKGAGANAQKIVSQQIAQNEVHWRGVDQR